MIHNMIAFLIGILFMSSVWWFYLRKKDKDGVEIHIARNEIANLNYVNCELQKRINSVNKKIKTLEAKTELIENENVDYSLDDLRSELQNIDM